MLSKIQKKNMKQTKEEMLLLHVINLNQWPLLKINFQGQICLFLAQHPDNNFWLHLGS